MSFQAADLADIYAPRGALIVATDDLRESARHKLLSFAVYSDPPSDRENLLQESAKLFEDHKIRPVSYRDLGPLRTEVAALLPL